MTQRYCSACDNVHPDTRGAEPWRWRCLKSPTPPGYGFVDPTYSPNPPFETCKNVNYDGFCQLFKEIPQPPDTEPKTKQFAHHKRLLETTKR